MKGHRIMPLLLTCATMALAEKADNTQRPQRKRQ